jgi:hypothetical protein
MENPKIKRWELTLSPVGTVHLHYETLLSSILQEGIGGLARELHQLADELNRLGSIREAHAAFLNSDDANRTRVINPGPGGPPKAAGTGCF